MKPGDIVEHANCGEGRVIEIDPSGVTVVFWRNGLRKRPAADLELVRTKEADDNYEPPDDPEAWSGGFAENH